MALFSRVHNWVSNEILTATDLNNEFNNLITNATADKQVGYSANVAQMQLTADPGSVGSESLPGNVAEELTRLRFMAKFFSGKAQWYDHTGRNFGAGALAVKTADLDAALLIPTANYADGSVTQIKRGALPRATSTTPYTGAVTITSSTLVNTAAITLSGAGRPVMLVIVPLAGTSISISRTASAVVNNFIETDCRAKVSFTKDIGGGAVAIGDFTVGSDIIQRVLATDTDVSPHVIQTTANLVHVANVPAGSIMAYDFPAAGVTTCTYSLSMNLVVAGATVALTNVSLMAIEL